ncbi:MAG TPA: DUF72 domain-containing protein [Povalibacter sp.]|nr:DUF72 domain-containing protein [Povalibacter sp.]
MTAAGHIRVGIGGWSYPPWRETFYPQEVGKNDELVYASRQLSAIEINSTFYRLPTPAVFAKWRESTPDGFVFSIKAPRYIAQRKILADARPYVERFIGGGIAELRDRLGPILWQLTPQQTFDPDDLQRFLEFLPDQIDGLKLRHALEVRHASFADPRFLEIARSHPITIVFEDDESYPGFADVTGNFVYARLRRSESSEPTGYSLPALQAWTERARTWARGHEPTDLPRIQEEGAAKTTPRDVFIYFINGAKERAPAAAMQLIENLSRSNPT